MNFNTEVYRTVMTCDHWSTLVTKTRGEKIKFLKKKITSPRIDGNWISKSSWLTFRNMAFYRYKWSLSNKRTVLNSLRFIRSKSFQIQKLHRWEQNWNLPRLQTRNYLKLTLKIIKWSFRIKFRIQLRSNLQPTLKKKVVNFKVKEENLTCLRSLRN